LAGFGSPMQGDQEMMSNMMIEKATGIVAKKVIGSIEKEPDQLIPSIPKTQLTIIHITPILCLKTPYNTIFTTSITPYRISLLLDV